MLKVKHSIRGFDLGLILVVSIGLICIVMGIGYGLPLHLIGDEESLIGGALKMLELKSFIPALHPAEFSFLYYPVVIPYLIILASIPVLATQFIFHSFSLAGLQDAIALDQQSIWLAARFMSAVISAGVVLCIYFITKELYKSKRIAFLSALVLSVSFFHSNSAHWVRHWIYATFFVYLTWYVTIRFIRARKGPYWLAGVIGGVGMGVSSVTIIGPVTAWLYALLRGQREKRTRLFVIISIALWVCIGGLLTMMHYSTIVAATVSKEGMLTHTKQLSDWLQALEYGFLNLAVHDTIMLALSLFALVVVRSYRSIHRTIFGFVFLYFSFLYFSYHIELRYIYLIVPACAMVAASGLDWIYQRCRSRIVGVCVIGFLLLFPAVSVLRYDYVLTKPATTDLALRWIRDNASDDAFIMSSRSIIVPRTKEALELDQQYGSIRFAERYTLSHPYLFEQGQPRYRYANVHFWDPSITSDQLADYVKLYRPKYFILEYSNTSDITGRGYSMIAGSKLIASFSGSETENEIDVNGNFLNMNTVFFDMDRFGPMIRIYQVRP